MKAFLYAFDWGLFLSVLTPILVAWIAGYFTLNQVKTNIRLSESTKWIEDLRELLSEFITQLNELNVKLEDLNTNLIPFLKIKHDINSETNRIEAAKLIKPVQMESRVLNKLKHKIMLYLSDGVEHKELRRLVSELYYSANINVADLKNTDFVKKQDKIDTLSDELITESRNQFKEKRKKSK